MDYLAPAIFKSVETVFHIATVNGQQIFEGRKTSPAISSYSDSVQTLAGIMERRRATLMVGKNVIRHQSIF